MLNLDQIAIKGFRSIRDQDIQLGPLNLLVGDSGSGKSNLLDAFSLLSDMRDGRLQHHITQAGGITNILRQSKDAVPALDIHLTFQDHINEYLVHLETDGDGNLTPTVETASFKADGVKKDVRIEPRDTEAGISRPINPGVPASIQTHMGGWRVHHFTDVSNRSPMRKAAAVHNNRRLRTNGSNLASVLYLIKVRHQAQYRRILDQVRLEAPFLGDFVLEPEPPDKDTINLKWRPKDLRRTAPAPPLSGGTLRYIALTTLLLQPTEFLPSIVLIDQPELGLSPRATSNVASLIKAVSSHAQVILATQSARVLDEFKPEDVLFTQRDGDGASTFTRLDPGDMRDWLKDYSLGQLWEKNVFSSPPIPE